MQDKNTHIDGEFTDQAWQEMQAILDQEMPVRNKKRRFVFWWYTGGIAVAASLIGLWIVHVPDENIIEINNNITAETILKPTEQTEPLNNDLLTSENKVNNHSSNKKTAQKNTEKKLKDIDPEKIQNTAFTEKESYANTLDIQLDNPESQVDYINEKIIDDQIGSSKNRLETPGLIAVSPVRAVKYDSEVQPSIPVSINKKKPFNLIVQGSALFRNDNHARGLGANILASIPIGKNNFSIETGLGYAYISQPLSFLIELQETDLGSGSGSFEAITDVAYSNVSFLDLSNDLSANFPNAARTEQLDRLDLHYLQLPVMLSYRIKRLRFSAGMQAGLLLVASSGGNFNGGVLNFINSYDEEFISQPGPLALADTAGKSNLSYFDLSGSFGIGYDFSSKYGVNLFYNTGLIDVIKNNSAKDFNRLFQLSIRYNW